MTQQVPTDQVLVTVSAGSTPLGATVTGGGALLGRTPFTAQVPVPRPRPGETQTFEFTFQLPGYQTQTITATPVNNTLTLNMLMVPEQPTVAADTVEEQTPPADQPPSDGPTHTVRGRGGGRIVDNSQAVGTASVDVSCVIAELAVTLNGQHSYYGDLIVTLEGPGGQRYQLQNHARSNPFRRHTVRRAVGQPSAGTWRIIVRDDVRADSGQLSGWSMQFTCR